MIRDIKPKSPVASLRRDYRPVELDRRFDAETVAAVVGMNRAFIARAIGRPGARPRSLSLREVLMLLDLDGYQETFVPRSRVPDYLLGLAREAPRALLDVDVSNILVGNARDLLPSVPARSVQCVVTSSPYWGMRTYDNQRDVKWADGEICPYGFEQTPEGFIRHTTELLYLLKPALNTEGSVWWNLMDTYNTRTPIRGNARERLVLMDGANLDRPGWTDHAACRHSAGHIYLDDAEQCSIPARVAERASRIGYKLRSFITWRKTSATPEPVKSRVTRQAEYVLHLSLLRAPYFNKGAWQQLRPYLGGPNERHESKERLTDVWCLPTSAGKNGHGAEFPLALPGRCIAISSEPGDLILDPFVGSGTTAVAATALGRRCLGLDVSAKYVDIARSRMARSQTPTALWETTQRRDSAVVSQDGAPSSTKAPSAVA